jgi:transcriptional regulator with XRE-family HTH domain
MGFGEKLSELLVKYQRSQRTLAKDSGVNYVTINRIVNNYPFRVTTETARKLAKALGCTKVERDDLLRLAGGLPKDVEDALLHNPELIELVRREMRKRTR